MMKVIFKLDPRDQRSNELVEFLRELGATEIRPRRRSYHPLDLLSDLVSSALKQFELLVYRLVSAVIKPRKNQRK